MTDKDASHDGSLPMFRAEDFVEQLGGDLDFAADLAEVFINDTEARVAQMQQKYAASEFEAAWLLAHSIKGSAGSLGAEGIALLAHQIEQAGKQAEFARMGELIPTLIATFAATRKALEDYLGG